MMTADRYEPEILDEPVWVVRLGHFDANDNLTVGATVGGILRGYRLTPEYRELLQAGDALLRPESLSTEQRALLWWMGNHEMVALIPANAPEQVLGLVPILRKSLTSVEPLGEEGYRLHTDGAESFVADELETRLIPYINGSRTFEEIADLVTDDLLQDPENRDSIAAAEADEGRTLRAFLADAALSLASHGLTSGLISLERAQ